MNRIVITFYLKGKERKVGSWWRRRERRRCAICALELPFYAQIPQPSIPNVERAMGIVQYVARIGVGNKECQVEGCRKDNVRRWIQKRTGSWQMLVTMCWCAPSTFTLFLFPVARQARPMNIQHMTQFIYTIYTSTIIYPIIAYSKLYTIL
jgi:hypothetical protein